MAKPCVAPVRTVSQPIWSRWCCIPARCRSLKARLSRSATKSRPPQPCCRGALGLERSQRTMDARLTQRDLAEQIEQPGDYYVMVVKRNQCRLYDDLTVFFQLSAIV